jgi:cobyric acid synthase cobQ
MLNKKINDSARKSTHKARAIMIQGTMSNAGKSLICAGLCRILKQDGYRVAPFKSQNMALNSGVTKDGLEMGRAQVVQAEAAGIEPSVLMNPILLKPVTNMGSQLIVCGQVRGNYEAAEYFRIKHTLIPEIMKAYDELASQNDIIVIEGAGSPAEINLSKGDFANMGMAKLAGAPVLLIGDIDRGGVFAQLYGTIKLLPEDEQDIIKGLVINKFRGDANLLSDGLDMISSLTDKPVAGVIPMLDVDIDDEDSLSSRFYSNSNDAIIDIAVIKLPKISNFTDMAPLEATEGVGVRYITRAQDFGRPDLIIIPGTKNTISDLMWMRTAGIEEHIVKLSKAGTPVIGICGGYQMLGMSITDKAGTEGGGSIAGIGLLPVHTEFKTEKHLAKTSATFLKVNGLLSSLSGVNITGYEIHMGKTYLTHEASSLLTLNGNEVMGCQNGNVYGSYMHGFFESNECRSAILRDLSEHKGLTFNKNILNWEEYKERQYDMLAEGIRSNLNMKMIYDVIEKGI